MSPLMKKIVSRSDNKLEITGKYSVQPMPAMTRA